MSAITFNIADLFEKAFGYKSQAFDPDFEQVGGSGSLPGASRADFGVHGSAYYAADALGREYFMPVKITYADDTATVMGLITDANGANSALNPAPASSLRTWNLPYPVISISSRKTIVETPLTERRGTVKELISIQDYEISIKGFIVGLNNEFPENDVITLRTIFEQNTALSIESPLTDIFLLRPDRSGSDQVVIRELTFPAIAGVKHVRPYELLLISDAPFNLISIS